MRFKGILQQNTGMYTYIFSSNIRVHTAQTSTEWCSPIACKRRPLHRLSPAGRESEPDSLQTPHTRVDANRVGRIRPSTLATHTSCTVVRQVVRPVGNNIPSRRHAFAASVRSRTDAPRTATRRPQFRSRPLRNGPTVHLFVVRSNRSCFEVQILVIIPENTKCISELNRDLKQHTTNWRRV